jgi:hypothetical protein
MLPPQRIEALVSEYRASYDGKNPLAYVRDILSRLPRMSSRDDLAPLLPCNWTPPTTPVATA